MSDADLVTALALGLIAAALYTLGKRGVGAQTWEERRTVKAPLTQGGVVQHRPPPSYIIPATDLRYYRRSVWYVCGTTEQIIEHLWLKRDPVSYHFEEDDGA